MNAKSILFLSLILITTGIQAQRIKGSDTVLPVAQQTAERFMNRNADSRVTRHRWWNRSRHLRLNG